jgi:hypothetical protein
MASKGGQEGASVECVEQTVGVHGHRGGPRQVAQQRNRAEHVTVAERGERAAHAAHVELALGDHIEALARLALAHDLLAGLHRHLREPPGHVLQCAERQRREQRHAPQQGEGSLRLRPARLCSDIHASTG